MPQSGHMTAQVGYWGLSIAFCCAWVAVALTVYRSRWYRVAPWFCVWVWIQTVQAILTTAAGMFTATWWTLRVWAPVEMLSLLALCSLCAEIFPRRLAIITGIAAIVTVPLARGMRPPGPGWFATLVAFREWLWALVAIALLIHIALLLWDPVTLAPGAFYSWCILAIYALAMVATGYVISATKTEWLSARATYRAISILCCIRWVMLAPRWRRAATPPAQLPPPSPGSPSPGGSSVFGGMIGGGSPAPPSSASNVTIS